MTASISSPSSLGTDNKPPKAQRAARLRALCKDAAAASELDGTQARAAALRLAPGLKAERLLDAALFGPDTALSFACRKRDAKLVKALIGLGADPNAARANGEPPMREALWRAANTPARIKAALACVKAMVEGGADPHRKNSVGERLIHAASFDSRLEPITRWLLSIGCDPSAAGDDGMTPLHYAAKRGDLATATLFLEAGASLSALSASGSGPRSLPGPITPAQMARQWVEYHQNPELVDFLESAERVAAERQALESALRLPKAQPLCRLDGRGLIRSPAGSRRQVCSRSRRLGGKIEAFWRPPASRLFPPFSRRLNSEIAWPKLKPPPPRPSPSFRSSPGPRGSRLKTRWIGWTEIDNRASPPRRS